MIRSLTRVAALFALLSSPVLAGSLPDGYPGAHLASGWSAFATEAARSLDVVGFVLLTLFVVLVGMCLDLFYHLRIGKFIPESLLGDVQAEMTNGEYEKALELCEKSDSAIGTIFAAALSKTDYSFERMAEAMRGEVRIQGTVWRQWVRQFRILAVSGFLLGFLGSMIQAMRFVADMAGRPNLNLSLASSQDVRGIAYNFIFALSMGAVLALVALIASTAASSKLEKILLESERLGEELLDPFRPLPLLQED